MIDYKALAERLDRFADWVEMNGFDVSDIRAAAQLARERTEAPEPFGWVGSDGIRQNPDVQVIGPESTHWAVPLYLHPAPQPQPTEAQIENGVDAVPSFIEENYSLDTLRFLVREVLRAAFAAKDEK